MSTPIKEKRVVKKAVVKKPVVKKGPKIAASATFQDFFSSLDEIPDDVTDLSQITDELREKIEKKMNKLVTY
jgi:ribosome-associated translation inhibitor RaiA